MLHFTISFIIKPTVFIQKQKCKPLGVITKAREGVEGGEWEIRMQLKQNEDKMAWNILYLLSKFKIYEQSRYK